MEAALIITGGTVLLIIVALACSRDGTPRQGRKKSRHCRLGEDDW